ncbi:hypothetical protein MHK_010011 [Candidatus Magnetomorum sp. HK-1]|nr:hypothetical protein MHK_010011 [Candidatus Magnetomorum sp. HK-1]
MNLNNYFSIFVYSLFIIISSNINIGFCENFNSIPLNINSWQRIAVGNWEETDEGIKFYAASYRSNHRVISKKVFNFNNSNTYVKWKVNSNSYARFYVGINGAILTHNYTTNHSYGNSVVISSNTWYFTRISVNTDKTYETVTCSDDYDDNGGNVIKSTSDTLTDSQWNIVQKTNIALLYYDPYDSTDVYIVIGEAKTNAQPVQIVWNEINTYDFEDDSKIPETFLNNNNWNVIQSDFGNAIYLTSNETQSITIDAENVVEVSFRVKFAAEHYCDLFRFNYSYHHTFSPSNQWSEVLTFPIPDNAESLVWTFIEDTKYGGLSNGCSVWIDDLEIKYYKNTNEIDCNEIVQNSIAALSLEFNSLSETYTELSSNYQELSSAFLQSKKNISDLTIENSNLQETLSSMYTNEQLNEAIAQKDKIITQLNTFMASMYTEDQLQQSIIDARRGLYSQENMELMINKILEWDTNNDGKIGLAEAIQSLMISSGVKPFE